MVTHITAKSKMNQKAYSILFCALFASTFAHDFWSKSAAHPPAAIHHVQKRTAESGVRSCVMECESFFGNNKTGLSILANGTANLIAIANITFGVAIVWDVEAGLFGIFNGVNRSAFIININTSLLWEVNFSHAWSASNTSLKVFLAGLAGLEDLKPPSVPGINISSVSTTLLVSINVVFVHLLPTLADAIKFNASLGIQILLKLVAFKIDLLKEFLKIIGNTVIVTKHDLIQILNILEGLGKIFILIPGGLIKAGVVINLTKIFTEAQSGFQILVNVLLALKGKVDTEIIKKIGDILNRDEFLFILIAQLGGNGNDVINGMVKVISAIVSYINGNLELTVLITIMLGYLTYNGQKGHDYFVIWNSTISVVIEALVEIDANNIFSGMRSNLTSLLNGTCIKGGVNISDIIKIFLTGLQKGESSLHVLILVLVKLEPVVAISVSISTCLLVLIYSADSYIGIIVLKKLGIAINVATEVSGSLITFIFEKVKNIVQLIRSGKSLWSILEFLPVFGEIVKAFGEAVYNVLGKTLYDMCNNSNFTSFIKALFQIYAKVNMGVSSIIIDKVKNEIKNCTFSWEISIGS